jgi:transposase
MKNQLTKNNSEIRAEQVTNVQPEAIYLGADLHKKTVVVTRIIDHGTPQPAQSFTWAAFWCFAKKQLSQAKKVYVVYEAGAFGFWAQRQLSQMGMECFVIHPEKLDPRQKRVQTDKLDSWHLADKLQRYVLGNKKAMVPVHVPSVEQENQRLETRHRRSLHKQLLSLRRRGQGLLLSQGIFETQSWWTAARWPKLQGRLSAQLAMVLGEQRELILDLEKRCRTVEKKIEATAPKALPQGFGRLTFALLTAELCTYERFKNRRNLGGFTGLGGAVSSSGPCHLDLSISKVGSPYVRTLLVELAWRMIYWQPDYTGLKAWKRLGPKGTSHKSQRKRAAVAVARQLAVDIWRWQTGRVTPEQLGWKMNGAPS